MGFSSMFSSASVPIRGQCCYRLLVPSNVSPCKAPSSTQIHFVTLFTYISFKPKIFQKLQKKNTNKPNHKFSWNSSFQFRLFFLTKEPRTRLERFSLKIIHVCSCFVFRKIFYRQEYF